MIGIPPAKEVNLIELDITIFRRINRNAVINGQRDMAVIEKRNQVVDILEGGAAGETMAGFFAFAIFSIRIQSLQSELAILRMGIPSSQQKSTELSSNGVAIGMQPAARMACTSLA